MKKYLALLRAINVGGKNKVAMKNLKQVFESLGYTNVTTYINSGNVIFESATNEHDYIKETIEEALKKFFGFPISIALRDSSNIQKLCKAIPSHIQNDTEMKADVLFLWEEFDNKNTLDHIKIHKEVDTLQYYDGAIVWSVRRKDYTKSGMKKFIGTTIYKNMTARNVNTVRKLGELMEE